MTEIAAHVPRFRLRPASALGTGDGQAFADGFVTVLKFLVLEGLRIAWHREEAKARPESPENVPLGIEPGSPAVFTLFKAPLSRGKIFPENLECVRYVLRAD